MALAVEDGRVGAWRMDTGETLFERNFGQHVSMLRYQPGGALLVVSTEDHALQILDRKSGETRVRFNQDGPVADKLCFTSDGLRLASGHRGRKLRIWDVSSTRLLREIDTGRSIASLVFDPQDELLFVGTWDGRVQIWRAATGELVRTLEGHALQVYGIVPVPNSRLFATNSADGTVRFWDPDVAECLVALDPHAGPCRNIAIVRDGNVLRVAYDDGKVREWDLRRYDREIEGNAAGQRSQRGLAPTAR
jgi:WD40 repeat protein